VLRWLAGCLLFMSVIICVHQKESSRSSNNFLFSALDESYSHKNNLLLFSSLQEQVTATKSLLSCSALQKKIKATRSQWLFSAIQMNFVTQVDIVYNQHTHCPAHRQQKHSSTRSTAHNYRLQKRKTKNHLTTIPEPRRKTHRTKLEG
jgi:hypothetical protein